MKYFVMLWGLVFSVMLHGMEFDRVQLPSLSKSTINYLFQSTKCSERGKNDLLKSTVSFYQFLYAVTCGRFLSPLDMKRYDFSTVKKQLFDESFVLTDEYRLRFVDPEVEQLCRNIPITNIIHLRHTIHTRARETIERFSHLSVTRDSSTFKYQFFKKSNILKMLRDLYQATFSFYIQSQQTHITDLEVRFTLEGPVLDVDTQEHCLRKRDQEVVTALEQSLHELPPQLQRSKYKDYGVLRDIFNASLPAVENGNIDTVLATVCKESKKRSDILTTFMNNNIIQRCRSKAKEKKKLFDTVKLTALEVLTLCSLAQESLARVPLESDAHIPQSSVARGCEEKE